VPPEPLTTVWMPFQLLKRCFFGVLDIGKCLHAESLKNFIKLLSGIRCIDKIWKGTITCIMSACTDSSPIGFFSWISFLENLMRKFNFY